MKKLIILLIVCSVATSLFLIPFGSTAFAESERVGSGTVKSYYSVEYETGTVLERCNENERMPIASMVKIMTLLITFDEIGKGNMTLEQNITVSENAASMGGSQMFLEANSVYTLRDLIKGVTVCSANDAAVAIAETVSGSVESFVEEMNAKAAELGMTDTKFCNTTGLPGGEQYSTARDVSVMTRRLLTNESYYKFSTIWMEDYNHPDGRVTQMVNTNKLVRFYKGCDAGKTGFTNDAMFCLSASAKKDNMRVVATVLGGSDSKTRFRKVTELFNYAFANYSQKAIVRKGESIANDVSVKEGKEKASVYADDDLTIFVEKGKEKSYKVSYSLKEGLRAPLSKNTVVGELFVTDADGNVLDKVNLRLGCDVTTYTYWDSVRKVLENWLI